MKSMEPSSPQSQFDSASPVASVPRCLPSWGNDQHAAGVGRPQIATLIDLQSIGHTRVQRICKVEEHAARTQGAVGIYGRRHPNCFRGIGIGDVENFFVGREGESVRTGHFARKQGNATILGRDAIDALKRNFLAESFTFSGRQYGGSVK